MNKMSQTPSESKGTLFITGASNGIGKELFSRLEGNYQRTKNFDIAESTEMDTRDYSEVAEAMKESLLPAPYQNDLIISAGVFRPVRFTEQTKEDIDFVLGVNLQGSLYTIQQFLRWHEETQNSTRPNIVIISSISAFFHGGEKNVVYDATKAALSYMVRDLANFKCIVNAVEPGTVRNTRIGEWSPQFDSDSASRELIESGQNSDIGEMGVEVTSSDVADTVEMLLLRNERGAINGTTITVDGGQTSFRKRF